VITLQIADPSSRRRGRPTETRPQISDSNIPTGSNIWSQAPQGCSIPRNTSSLTARLLRLAGLRWRYSNPPPNLEGQVPVYIYIYILQEQDGPVQSQSQMSKSRYDRRPVNQYVLMHSPLGIKGLHIHILHILHILHIM
jgi:hypothetical protein